jgi:hypothetical protein
VSTVCHFVKLLFGMARFGMLGTWWKKMEGAMVAGHHLCYNCVNRKILIHVWYKTTRVPSKPLLLAHWSTDDQFSDHVIFMSN